MAKCQPSLSVLGSIFLPQITPLRVDCRGLCVGTDAGPLEPV